MSEPRSYRNYIDGEWVESAGGRTFENRNPAEASEVLGIFQDSTPDDVAAAVGAARAAERRWCQVPAPKRAEYLFRMGEILVRRKEDYASAMTMEMGKPIRGTRADVQDAIDVCYYIAGEGRRLHGYTTPSELPNRTCYSLRMPVGVAGLITPWLFPMAIPAWKLIPALVCGNTVVLKPATDTPLSSYHLIKLCQEVGIPRGVVNLVTGSGAAVGETLCRHPEVDLISFTGCSESGREIARSCSETLKRVSLELGGKNAMIVLDDARIELAVEGALWGAFGTTGQRSTATSRIIVHKKVHEEFVDRLVERASDLKVGGGIDESIEVGPMINEAHLKKVMEYIQIGRDEGADPVLGGVRMTKGEYGAGYFFQPTVFTGVEPTMRIARDEFFGPVVSVLQADSLDHALEIANDTVSGLSASIYTQDVNKAFTAVRDLSAGITHVNSATSGAECHLPFGGVRRTGNGTREGAAHTALEIFSEWKAVYVDFSGRSQKATVDNS